MCLFLQFVLSAQIIVEHAVAPQVTVHHVQILFSYPAMFAPKLAQILTMETIPCVLYV